MGKTLPRLTVTVTLAAVGILMQPNLASANDDPHRSFAAATPFDLPSNYCGFPVHFAFPVNNEYSTISAQPDGSTVIKTTGSLMVSLTNNVTGKSIKVNASGPAVVTVAPDGVTGTVVGEGLAVTFAANGTQVGLPSDLVLTAGLIQFTENFNLNTIVIMARQPHVLSDLCAALS